MFCTYFVSEAPLVTKLQKLKYIKTFQIKNLDLPKTSNKEIAILSRSFKLMAKEIKAKIDAITVEKNERESVLASLQKGLIVLDKNIKILSVNDVAKEYLALDLNPIEGKRALDIIKNKKMNKFFSKIKNSIEQNSIDDMLDGEVCQDGFKRLN